MTTNYISGTKGLWYEQSLVRIVYGTNSQWYEKSKTPDLLQAGTACVRLDHGFLEKPQAY